MQARLGFAVAVQVDADILLVDEVLAVGDPAFQERCLEAMLDLSRRGVTIVFVSHNADLMRRFCTRMVTIDAGRVVAEAA
jgi:ABC-type polysaccharide/polyol phosphate transport system ATPase subunit